MLRFDMRAPKIGAPTVELYSAATEMCAWAEDNGALAAVLCEHHGSDDGYLPSPLILASAIAARTNRLSITIAALLLPFYDTVRLAEDMAVLDIISKGRVSYILALGYRPEEFEQFGVDMRTRGRLVDQKLDLLRKLRTGPVDVDGRHIDVTPRPFTDGGPSLMWGGGSVAAARRAGRYGMGMLGNANVEGMARGVRGGVSAARPRTRSDLPAGPRHPIGVLRRRRRRQGLGRDRRAPAARRACVRGLEPRQRHLRRLLGCDDGRRTACQADVAPDLQRRRRRGAGPRRRDTQPVALCGGIPPEIAWPYLKRVGEVVLPEAAR